VASFPPSFSFSGDPLENGKQGDQDDGTSGSQVSDAAAKMLEDGEGEGWDSLSFFSFLHGPEEDNGKGDQQHNGAPGASGGGTVHRLDINRKTLKQSPLPSFFLFSFPLTRKEKVAEELRTLYSQGEESS